MYCHFMLMICFSLHHFPSFEGKFVFNGSTKDDTFVKKVCSILCHLPWFLRIFKIFSFFFVLMLLYFAWKLMKYQQSFQADMWCWGFLYTNLCVVFFFLFLYWAWAENSHEHLKVYSHCNNTTLKPLKWMKWLRIFKMFHQLYQKSCHVNTWKYSCDMLLCFILNMSQDKYHCKLTFLHNCF